MKNLEDMTLAELATTYNEHAEKKIKKFSDRKTALRRTREVVDVAETQERVTRTVAKSKTQRIPRADSKSSRIRAALAKVDRIDANDLARQINYDRRNTLILVSILANPKRTKNPLPARYDRKSGEVVRA